MQLPGFDYRSVDVDGVSINTAVAGDGPPVLLLHGYPQTHLMWRHVAPTLTEHHTVVVTDLRGYGDSAKPAPADDESTYAKRAMATDQVGVMRRLGLEAFDLVGHDRGARVAHRLTLDHPDAVRRLAVLDILPTRYVFENADLAMGKAYFHWFFLAAGAGIAEHMIGADPEFWLRAMTDRLLAGGTGLEPDAMAEYLRCFADPAAIAASCADYRSAASVDLDDDERSWRGGDRVRCPTLVLWGANGFVGRTYQPLQVWKDYATDVRGKTLDSGHFLPEEAPGAVLAELLSFLTG